jgi:hypothetical protein
MSDEQAWGVDEEPIPLADEKRIRFTDEEYAFLRHVRFGELPPRVKPEDMVALVETEARRDIPETLGDPDAWRGLRAAGAPS